MNIYLCHEKDEYAGLFISAPTRGVAKKIFAMEIDCEYTDVRSEVRKRGVNCDIERIFMADNEADIEDLQYYGLKYDEEMYL